MERSNVVDRVKEQLRLAGKVRGHRTPIYRDNPDGTKTLSHYAQQHFTADSKDIIELCDLARDQADPIVQALRKGHTFALLPGCPGKGTNYADDVFHLLEQAEAKHREV